MQSETLIPCSVNFVKISYISVASFVYQFELYFATIAQFLKYDHWATTWTVLQRDFVTSCFLCFFKLYRHCFYISVLLCGSFNSVRLQMCFASKYKFNLHSNVIKPTIWLFEVSLRKKSNRKCLVDWGLLYKYLPKKHFLYEQSNKRYNFMTNSTYNTQQT